MVYKPFDQTLYDENDRVAKQTAADFLTSTGKFVFEVPFDQQPEAWKERDFIIKYTPFNRDVRVEVERKPVWEKRGEWQGWQSLDVPFRKSESKAYLFIMVNKHLDTLAVIRMKDVLNSPIYRKNTYRDGKPLTRNEEFFAVPLNKIQFYTNKNGTWIGVA